MTMTQRRCARAAMPALIGTGALLAALIPSHFTASTPVHAASDHPCLVTVGAGDTAFVRNFNPFGSAMDFTNGGIFEPLEIITAAGGGHTYPWLSTGYQWRNGNKTLVINLRRGVTWSDGQAFTAKDVLYTYTAGQTNAALDQINYMPRATSNIVSVAQTGPYQVTVRFAKVDTTVLPQLLSNIKVIPQHIWSTVKNPVTYTNANPVGTGPFTQVQKFSSQDYVLGKNPHYWQAGKPAVSCIERSFASGNDAAALQMVSGAADWTHNFVPNVQKVYVAKDPTDFHYFYSTEGTPVGLFFNDTVYPYSLANFRKAVSMSLQRPLISEIAEYGYEPPAEATGITHEFPTWVNHSLDAQSRALTTYNPAAAKALLTSSGFSYKNGHLYDPKGQLVSFSINVDSGFTDWVQSLHIIEQNLRAAGMDVTIKLSADYNSWANLADKGLTPHLHWTYSGVTPYYYYNSFMSTISYKPTGVDAVTTGNWGRYKSVQADQLLAQYRHTTDAATQHAVVNKLQQLAITDMPFVPIDIGANWETYSTKYFAGYPTPQDDYAYAIYNQYPDNNIVLTRITPAK